ncbi:uncharacterized protein (TIGR02145 family) [Pedobacter africanus]|uniref:Uncharacterized protein (TIGR02145 family) n=1 Tax=Pedobacter africanus TaxID=151894 RepID=A0ACC6KRL0_9SPHI|nr:fibrobacter succinogenes major paralogous domain-containing protein [Pedobacter africanus]MDR6781990.1 uncharacterized protein (TIGR02145 family) [Pedobacter africanus]
MKSLLTFVLFIIFSLTKLFAQNTTEAVTMEGDTVQLFTNKTWKFKPRPAADVYDIDSNKYKTVRIGDQVWMAENLKTTRFKDGTPITNAKTLEQWRGSLAPAYAAYNNDSSLVAENGLLYNWGAVSSNSCLCPEGWRVPTKEDYETMLRANTKSLYYNVNNTGGFMARLSGARYMSNAGQFLSYNFSAHFYTSSITAKNDPYFLSLTPIYSNTEVRAYDGTNPKESRLFGLSVRCIRMEQPFQTFSQHPSVQPQNPSAGGATVVKPQPKPGYTAVYSASSDGTQGTKILYFVKNGVVYAADQSNNVSTRVLRYIVGEKVFGADANTGARTNTVLYYIVGTKVYAADLQTRERTNTVLHHIVNNVVYAAEAYTGAITNRKLRFIIGGEITD